MCAAGQRFELLARPVVLAVVAELQWSGHAHWARLLQCAKIKHRPASSRGPRSRDMRPHPAKRSLRTSRGATLRQNIYHSSGRAEIGLQTSSLPIAMERDECGHLRHSWGERGPLFPRFAAAPRNASWTHLCAPCVRACHGRIVSVCIARSKSKKRTPRACGRQPCRGGHRPNGQSHALMLRLDGAQLLKPDPVRRVKRTSPGPTTHTVRLAA